MGNLSECVRPDGTLDDSKIWRREPLYQGMNGRFVERFYVAPEESYIFKPLTNEETMGREAWVYSNVLSFFPPVYPKLLATSCDEQSLQGAWSIFEDLGELTHFYRLDTALQVARLIAWWHSAPVPEWPELAISGPKPTVEMMAAQLLHRQDEAKAVLQRLGLSDHIFTEVQQVAAGKYFSGADRVKVLSHGDLHIGNYAVAGNGRLYIIDWEHAHLNTPYWDLFHLIDMSHPLYPKQMTFSDRERIIDEYINQSQAHGVQWNRDVFFREYGCFGAVFSLWMMLLIERDLIQENSVWPRERLLEQWNETAAGLAGCLAQLEAYPHSYQGGFGPGESHGADGSI